jgi:hypothetical protein
LVARAIAGVKFAGRGRLGFARRPKPCRAPIMLEPDAILTVSYAPFYLFVI